LRKGTRDGSGFETTERNNSEKRGDFQRGPKTSNCHYLQQGRGRSWKSQVRAGIPKWGSSSIGNFTGMDQGEVEPSKQFKGGGASQDRPNAQEGSQDRSANTVGFVTNSISVAKIRIPG